MKKTISTLIAISLLSPLTVFAQSSDSVIFDLLSSLDGPVPSQSSAAVVATATPVIKPKTTAVTGAVQQAVLAPSYLFSVDGNQPTTDTTVDSLRSVLQSLIAQFGLLAANSSQASSPAVAATTTAEIAEPAPPKKIYTRDLRAGSRGEDVRALQEFLIARGLLFGEATGYYGILTTTAVLTFQTEQGLPAVGNVGPLTREILNALPTERLSSVPPAIPFGPVSIPYIASSTSSSFNFSTTTGTSTAAMGTSSPMFDYFAPPVSVSMSILPTEAPIGGSVAVTWLSQNATSCAASDGWDGPKATLGAAKIEPLQFSLNLVLTCTGPGGVASTSALVLVGLQ